MTGLAAILSPMRPALLPALRNGFDARSLLTGSTGVDATLVIFAGQSNSIGWSTDPQNTTSLTNGRGYEFRQSGATGAFIPLGNTLLGRTQGGPQSAFAQTWTTNGGGVCLCVNVGVNGASLVDAAKQAETGVIATDGYEGCGGGTWDLASANSWYTRTGGAKSIIDKAITAASTAGFLIKKKVVLWIQGETDGNAGGNISASTYDANLRNLIDRFVSDYTINGFFISALGTPGGSANPFWDAIRTAQATAAAARSSIATVAFSGATGFFAAGKMVDGLHYTQAGYNDVGSGLATAGLAFIGGLSLAAPPSTLFATINSNPPILDRWKRFVMTSQRNGSFDPAIYVTGNTTPKMVTWWDTSGVNKMRGGQNAGMTFSDSSSKRIVCYVSNTAGVNSTFVGGGTLALTKLEILDNNLNMNRFALSEATDMIAGFEFPNADIKRMNPAIARDLTLSGGTLVALDDSVLTTLSGLTNIAVARTPTPRLNYALAPSLRYLDVSQCALSVADVNDILVKLDTNGLSNGNVNVSQYRLSPPIAAATPTGAGLAAKASLQSKGWTVTTD